MFRDKTYILTSCSDISKHFITNKSTERSTVTNDRGSKPDQNYAREVR